MGLPVAGIPGSPCWGCPPAWWGGPIPASAVSLPPKPPPRPQRKQGWGMPQPCLPPPPASDIKIKRDPTHNRRRLWSQGWMYTILTSSGFCGRFGWLKRVSTGL